MIGRISPILTRSCVIIYYNNCVRSVHGNTRGADFHMLAEYRFGGMQ